MIAPGRGGHETIGVNVVGQLLTLRQVETVRLDPDRLELLYSQMGEAAADDVICRAVEELAIRLTRTEQQWRNGDWHEMARTARSLIAIADQVGMTKLARIAGDVVQAARAGDSAAVGATLFRLIRVGERSLTAIWDLQDLSG
ncbi:hypothetical protein SAMN05421751_102109 [Jhaorihella thermophila]|uniref:Hpt domain-containing protein n=1 Tax=Jhaorihella thermophila TaxID=488547 RepID=A0A1H5T6K9_9RHOB|nr:hypothetical protein SAMN05421751_102109 [Jhaorihella thermophila]